MSAAKPTRPPSFDARGFSKRLYERVLQANGTPYGIFDYENDAAEPINFPRWKQWVQSVRDVVSANAIYLDAVKQDVDAHSQAIIELRQDVKALQEAPPTRPFP